MKKVTTAALSAVILMLFIAGCSGEAQQNNASQGRNSESQAQTEKSSDTQSSADEAWKNNTGTIDLDSMTVSGDGVSVKNNIVTITKAGDFTVKGTLKDGSILISASKEDKVKLRLSGVNITASDGPAINCTSAKKLFITLTDNTENILTDSTVYSEEGAKAALFSNDTLEIKGGGTLTVTGNYKHAVASDDDIIIENGMLTLTAVKDGIHANDDITINNGNITVKKAYDALQSEGTLTVNGGTLKLAAEDDGIHADGDLTVHNGTVNVTEGNEGIESKTKLTVNGGTIEVTVTDDGFNASNDITINGGNIYCASSGGDAVDSNGTVNLNGGTVVACGAQEPEGGLDCDENTFNINGGTLVATGGTNSKPTDSSKQYSVSLGGGQAGDVINITQDNNNVLTFVLPKTCSSVLYSSPSLAGGKAYTVLTGGAVSGGKAFHGLYTGAAVSGGTQSAEFTAADIFTNAGGSTGGMGGGGQGGFGGGPGM